MNRKERTKMVKWARDLRDAVRPCEFVYKAAENVNRISSEMLKEVREWSAKHVVKK